MLPIILTDIEGTTSRMDFVHSVLFPYARQRLPSFLAEHGDQAEVAHEMQAVRTAIGDAAASRERVTTTLIAWLDEDRKATPLKALQGMIWQQGFAAGDFTAHVYADAVDCLRSWHARGHAIYVYSSGSVAAQKLFFQHSVFGDLSGLFSGHFDTTIGAKREVDSYRRIAQTLAVAATSIHFLSDIEAELDAAKAAGMGATQLLRADAKPESHGRHPQAASFAELRLGTTPPLHSKSEQ
jgi:enolase-phosphatase E1